MNPSSACLDLIREQVGRALAEFLARQRDVLVSAGEELLPALDAMSGLIARGKRLRPAFCYWGWRGAGGEDRPEIMAAAAALELLHTGALIHDDVMDASDTRRGQPALHRRFAARHADSGWRGSADGFGTGTAILLGDLLLCWTDEMFRASGLPPEAIRRAQPVLDRMRTEVIAGQYLDLLGQAAGNETAASALRVVEFKTAKYTIERPLQLGAALAGPEDDALSRAYSGYGLPLGTAFQLRDDILGMFGNPAQTGKPTGDDLRAGKRTVLLATALARATTEQAAVIDRHLGDPMLDEAGTAEVQAVIAATGALTECERMIDAKVRDALAALSAAPVAPEVSSALTELAIAATARRD
ncbi:MAG: polyprenyl synthetase family protein [Nocardiopsaceae bacterium]|jgi:geranylgeranyl diphosphate synthase type I|nr:polyprenyl synthetase family protein [Nocardiopsaceae bacterium]